VPETIGTTTLRQVREATVREHVDAENRHDPDAAVATFSASRGRYDIPAMVSDGDVPGHDAVRALLEGMFTVFPDFDVEPGLLRHGTGFVLLEVTLTAPRLPTGRESITPEGPSRRAWPRCSISRRTNWFANGCTWTSATSPASSPKPDPALRAARFVA
jgi:hypothetical protein